MRLPEAIFMWLCTYKLALIALCMCARPCAFVRGCMCVLSICLLRFWFFVKLFISIVCGLRSLALLVFSALLSLMLMVWQWCKWCYILSFCNIKKRCKILNFDIYLYCQHGPQNAAWHKGSFQKSILNFISTMFSKCKEYILVLVIQLSKCASNLFM